MIQAGDILVWGWGGVGDWVGVSGWGGDQIYLGFPFKFDLGSFFFGIPLENFFI